MEGLCLRENMLSGSSQSQKATGWMILLIGSVWNEQIYTESKCSIGFPGLGGLGKSGE